MAKMNLPAVDFDVTLTAGRQKAMIDAATGKKTEYVVRVDQLRTIPGFNVRVRETDDYRQHLDALKQSIRENGYYPNKPLAGYIGKDGDEDVIFVTDGHTRLEAVREINEEALDPSEEIEGVPIILKPADSNMADLTIALVQDNAGRPLTPYEMGVVVQRLAHMKDALGNPLFTKAEIAKKLSITERYIDDLNVLASAPAKVRNAVLEGKVSSTLAIQELRRNPKKAEERITAAIAKASASGREKATKKDVGGVRMQTIRANVSLATGDVMGGVLKALAAEIRKAVPHSAKDAGDKLEVDGTITVAIQIPAPEPAPKAKKATTKKTTAKKSGTSKAPAKKATTAKAPKPAKAAEATSGDKPAIPLKADADDGEPVKLPPKVESDAGGDPDDI